MLVRAGRVMTIYVSSMRVIFFYLNVYIESNVEIFNNVCSLQCTHLLSLKEKTYYCALSDRIVDDSALDGYLLKGCEHLNNQSC
jgi:hypothetical protein